jgi:hypothetical protein
MTTEASVPPSAKDLSQDFLIQLCFKMLLYLDRELVQGSIDVRLFNNTSDGTWSLEIQGADGDDLLVNESALSPDPLAYMAAVKLRKLIVDRAAEAEKLLQETAVILPR